MFQCDFLDHLDVIAAFEVRDHFAVDRGLAAHVSIFFGDDGGAGRQRFGLCRFESSFLATLPESFLADLAVIFFCEEAFGFAVESAGAAGGWLAF